VEWNVAWRLARHPYIDTFKWVEEGIFRFRMKEGYFIYDQEMNEQEGFGNIAIITLATESEDEFMHYMNNLVITEEERVRRGIENDDVDLDEVEAWWDRMLSQDEFRQAVEQAMKRLRDKRD